MSGRGDQQRTAWWTGGLLLAGALWGVAGAVPVPLTAVNLGPLLRPHTHAHASAISCVFLLNTTSDLKCGPDWTPAAPSRGYPAKPDILPAASHSPPNTSHHSDRTTDTARPTREKHSQKEGGWTQDDGGLENIKFQQSEKHTTQKSGQSFPLTHQQVFNSSSGEDADDHFSGLPTQATGGPKTRTLIILHLFFRSNKTTAKFSWFPYKMATVREEEESSNTGTQSSDKARNSEEDSKDTSLQNTSSDSESITPPGHENVKTTKNAMPLLGERRIVQRPYQLTLPYSRRLPLSNYHLPDPRPSSHSQPREPSPTSHSQPHEPSPTSHSQPQEPIPTSHSQPHEPSPTSHFQPHEPSSTNHYQPHESNPKSHSQPHEPSSTNHSQPHEPSPTSHSQPHEPSSTNHYQPHESSPKSHSQPHEPSPSNNFQPREPDASSHSQPHEPNPTGHSKSKPHTSRTSSHSQTQEPRPSSHSQPHKPPPSSLARNNELGTVEQPTASTNDILGRDADSTAPPPINPEERPRGLLGLWLLLFLLFFLIIFCLSGLLHHLVLLPRQ